MSVRSSSISRKMKSASSASDAATSALARIPSATPVGVCGTAGAPRGFAPFRGANFPFWNFCRSRSRQNCESAREDEAEGKRKGEGGGREREGKGESEGEGEGVRFRHLVLVGHEAEHDPVGSGSG